MKTTHITTSQRAIAYVLLVSQLLTSCTWNETILPIKQQEGPIQPITSYAANTESTRFFNQNLATNTTSQPAPKPQQAITPQHHAIKPSPQETAGIQPTKPVNPKPKTLPKQSLATNTPPQPAPNPEQTTTPQHHATTPSQEQTSIPPKESEQTSGGTPWRRLYNLFDTDVATATPRIVPRWSYRAKRASWQKTALLGAYLYNTFVNADQMTRLELHEGYNTSNVSPSLFNASYTSHGDRHAIARRSNVVPSVSHGDRPAVARRPNVVSSVSHGDKLAVARRPNVVPRVSQGDRPAVARRLNVVPSVGLRNYKIIIQKNTPIPSLYSLPLLLGSYPGNAFEVKLSSDGNTAFVADYYNGLKILNISNLANPSLIGNYTGKASDVTLSSDGKTAFVVDWNNGLKILNISNLSHPFLLGSYPDFGNAYGVTLSSDGKTAFVAHRYNGLKILNIKDLSHPSLLGTYPGYAEEVTLSSDGNTAFVAGSYNGLKILNIKDLSHPSLLGTYPGYAEEVTLSSDGNTAFVAGSYKGFLEILNISDLSNPSLLSTYSGNANGVTLSSDGKTAFVSDAHTGLEILNISDLSNPSLLSTYSGSAYGVTLSSDGNTAFVADWFNGLEILDVSRMGLVNNLVSSGIDGDTNILVGVPATFWVQPFFSANASALGSSSYSYESPELVLDGAMSGTPNWVEFSKAQNKLQITSPKDFSGGILSIILPINYYPNPANQAQISTEYQVFDFPVSPTLNISQQGAHLVMASPAAVVSLQMQILGNMKPFINFITQQFGALTAAFDPTRRQVYAFGPIDNINDMLQGLRYAYLPTYTQPKMKASSIPLQFILNDALNAQQTIRGNKFKFVNLGMFNEDQAPTITNPLQKQLMSASQLVLGSTFDFMFASDTFTDLEGDAMSYTVSKLPSWLTFDAGSRRFVGTPNSLQHVGNTSITLTASDGYVTTSDKFNLQVVYHPPTLQHPIASQLPKNGEVLMGENFNFVCQSDTFQNVDQRPLSYTVSTLPSWLSFDAGSRRFVGTPNSLQHVGNTSITLTASDGYVTTSDKFNLQVVYHPPTLQHPIASQLPKNGEVLMGENFNFVCQSDTFQNVDQRPLSYTVSTLPSWLTFDAGSRRFVGIPNSLQHVGNTSITLTASDGYVTTSDKFNLQVVYHPPTLQHPIASQLPKNGEVLMDENFNFVCQSDTFQNVDQRSLSYTVSTLPNWLTFDAGSRRFVGTPNSLQHVGNTSITLTASDGYVTTSDKFNLQVLYHAPTLQHPIASQLPKNGEVLMGENFNFVCQSDTFQNIDQRPLSYTVSTLPSWLTFDTGSRRFVGTPNSLQHVGNTSITLTASDGYVTTSDKFNLQVVYHAPTLQHPIASQLPKNGEVLIGENFNFVCQSDTFQNVDQRPLSYTVSTLPSWLTFDAGSRRFVGTPNSLQHVGNTSITLTASDGYVTTSDKFNLQVVYHPPTLQHPIASQLPKNGEVLMGENFNFVCQSDTFQNVDQRPLSYTVSTLPSWLTFDAGSRRFVGTPNSLQHVGNTSITLTASDGYVTTSDKFNLQVVYHAPTLQHPIASQLPKNGEVLMGENFNFVCQSDTFQNVDQRSLSYTVSTLPNWLTFDAGSRRFVGTPNSLQHVGNTSITLTASDGYVTTSDKFNLQVLYHAPTLQHPIASQLPKNGEVLMGKNFNFVCQSDTFQNVDQRPLSYKAVALNEQGKAIKFPRWLSFDGASLRFYGTPASNEDKGLVRINVTATDGYIEVVDTFQLNVINSLSLQPLNQTKLAVQTPGNTITVRASISEPYTNSIDFITQQFGVVNAFFGKNTKELVAFGPLSFVNQALLGLRYGYKPNHPAGLLRNASAIPVNISVDDSINFPVQQIVTLANFVENQGPVVNLNNPIATQFRKKDIIINQGFEFTFDSNSFMDPEGDSLTYRITKTDGSEIPEYLKFDASSRKISGILEASAAVFEGIKWGGLSPHKLRLYATDGYKEVSQDVKLEAKANLSFILTQLVSWGSIAITLYSLLHYRAPLHGMLCKGAYKYDKQDEIVIGQSYKKVIPLIGKDMQIAYKIWLTMQRQAKENKVDLITEMIHENGRIRENVLEENIKSTVIALNSSPEDASSCLQRCNTFTSRFGLSFPERYKSHIDEKAAEKVLDPAIATKKYRIYIEGMLAKKLLKANKKLEKTYKNLKGTLSKEYKKNWYAPLVQIRAQADRDEKMENITINEVEFNESLIQQANPSLSDQEKELISLNILADARGITSVPVDAYSILLKKLAYETLQGKGLFSLLYESFKGEALSSPFSTAQGESIHLEPSDITKVAAKVEKKDKGFINLIKRILGLNYEDLPLSQDLPDWLEVRIKDNVLSLQSTSTSSYKSPLSIWIKDASGYLAKEFKIQMQQGEEAIRGEKQGDFPKEEEVISGKRASGSSDIAPVVVGNVSQEKTISGEEQGNVPKEEIMSGKGASSSAITPMVLGNILQEETIFGEEQRNVPKEEIMSGEGASSSIAIAPMVLGSISKEETVPSEEQESVPGRPRRRSLGSTGTRISGSPLRRDIGSPSSPVGSPSKAKRKSKAKEQPKAKE